MLERGFSDNSLFVCFCFLLDLWKDLPTAFWPPNFLIRKKYYGDIVKGHFYVITFILMLSRLSSSLTFESLRMFQCGSLSLSYLELIKLLRYLYVLYQTWEIFSHFFQIFYHPFPSFSLDTPTTHMSVLLMVFHRTFRLFNFYCNGNLSHKLWDYTWFTSWSHNPV